MDGSSLDGSGAINGSNNNATGMSRAERFEDEKRRIIESCFAKVDPDGACMYDPLRGKSLSPQR
jgi:hypothetical protein